MFPTIEEARKELELAEKLNPGPWVKHSINVGIAAKNIAEKVPDTLEEKTIKEYLRNCEADDYDKLIQICDALATDYGFVILEKRFVDVTRRYGIIYRGGTRRFTIKSILKKKWAVPFMMCCRILEEQRYYARHRGSRRESKKDKQQ